MKGLYFYIVNNVIIERYIAIVVSILNEYLILIS